MTSNAADGIRILGTEARPRAALPRWISLSPAVALAISLAGHLLPRAVDDSFRTAAIFVSILGGIAFGGWIEDRAYHTVRARAPLAAFILPFAGPFAGFVVAISAALLTPEVLRVNDWLIPGAIV